MFVWIIMQPSYLRKMFANNTKVFDWSNAVFLYIWKFATMIQEKLYKTIKDDCKERETFLLDGWFSLWDFLAYPSILMINNEIFTRHEEWIAVYVMVIWRKNVDCVAFLIESLLNKSRSKISLQLLRNYISA